jgi:hypothetical protein
MVIFAFIVAGLALAGALASWVAGGWLFARGLRTVAGQPAGGRVSWFVIAVWPFATKRLQGAAAEQAAAVNKALVAIIACLMVAGAAISAATNLARVPR